MILIQDARRWNLIRAIERTGYTVSTHDRRADGWHVVVIESPRGVDVVRVADPHTYDIEGAYRQWVSRGWITRKSA